MSAAQFKAFMHDGKPVPKKSVVLTFDDGYLDNWQYAHPILQQYGFNAIMFLVTAWVGTGQARPCATFKDITQNAVTAFEAYSHEHCKQLIKSGQTDRVIVRQSEIDAMLQLGTFEFHSHTHTHTRWDKLLQNTEQKRQALAQDLGKSCEYLRRWVGSDSVHLCWPQGYFDADYVEIAADFGFSMLYTTNSRGQNVSGNDTRHIYRVAVKNRAGLMFGQRVMLAASKTFGPLYDRLKR